MKTKEETIEEKIIEEIREKANSCSLNTKESRARYGAYIDCIIILKQLLVKSC